MSEKLPGANDAEKLKSLAQRTYKAQAVWFLNAFWDEIGEAHSEKIWEYVAHISKLDLQKGAEGTEVDEMNMHRFLEFFKETMTVREMRDTLRSKGAISESVKLVALIHYLIFRFNLDFHVLVNASQGDNQKEINEAQRRLDEVSVAYQEAEQKAQAAKAALAQAKATESQAKKAEAEAKAQEASAKSAAEAARKSEASAKDAATLSQQRQQEAKAAQEELEAALKELKDQEDAFNNKTEDLKKKSSEGSVVSQNKAKNELAQHLASDPLPLRRAKITQEAAVKKADKATKAANDARVASEAAAEAATKSRKASEESAVQESKARGAAEEASRDAETARLASEDATRQAEEALEAMQQKVDEAEAFLNEVKSRPGKASGAIWWMSRELHEKKKFLPERKGGIKK